MRSLGATIYYSSLNTEPTVAHFLFTHLVSSAHGPLNYLLWFFFHQCLCGSPRSDVGLNEPFPRLQKKSAERAVPPCIPRSSNGFEMHMGSYATFRSSNFLRTMAPCLKVSYIILLMFLLVVRIEFRLISFSSAYRVDCRHGWRVQVEVQGRDSGIQCWNLAISPFEWQRVLWIGSLNLSSSLEPTC